MASSKVVKVEEVNRPPYGSFDINDSKFERSKTNQTFSTALAYGTESSLLPVSRQEYEAVLDDVGEESRDQLYPMPENWPKLPQIFRRRSCELTTTTSPCVNKAVSHLELLQNIIEDGYKEHEEEVKSRLDTAPSKKEIRFSVTRESTKGHSSSTSHHSSASSTSTPQLSIQGVGITEDEKQQEMIASVPYLGAEDVIDEVMTLLARLENDRLETEEALIREKERVVRLGAKIDNHCLKRMIDLPAAVQKEHEECIMDLNELNWHVAYSSRNEARIKERKEIAEVLNKRLKEDIEFVKKHIPLVEEKLELELEAMEKIRNAQDDTNQELDNTKSRQKKTEAKSNEANIKAEKERGHIKHELDTVRDALASINEELSEAKMTHNAYVHQINDIQQQLKDNEQELKVLEVKNENAKVAEEMMAAKVKDIGVKISESEFEHTRLDCENAQLQSDLNVKKRKFNDEISELEQKIKIQDSKLRKVVLRNQEVESEKRKFNDEIAELEQKIKIRDSKLRKVVLRNQEVESEVEDYKDKLRQCQRQKDADEKNIARIHKETQKIQQQMSVTMDEFNRVAGLNAVIREQLTSEQDKAFKMEESLKITAETLRKQVKDEVHTKTVLASRISSDTNEITKSRVEIREKKNKYLYGYDSDSDDGLGGRKATRVADDVVGAVKVVKEKVEKLRSAKEEKSRKKRQLSAQRDETIKQRQESEKKFQDKISKIEPHHNHLKKDLLDISKRLDHMEWKSDVMKNKMEDMDKSQGMMDRLVASTGKALETLGEELKELSLQIEASQKIEDDLKGQYHDVLSRIRTNNDKHRKFLTEREAVKRNLEEEKTKSIVTNKDLASKYRTLQNHFMVIKDKYMNNFEDRVKYENAIKDTRQLQALQMRMHGAMMEYYKYRGLYNTNELNRMEDLSVHNSKKVITLQESMDKALKNITDFLQTQMTGEAARKMAWAAVQKQEARASRKQAPVSAMKTSSTIQVKS